MEVTMFDCDDGNGNYDVVTSMDRERWEEEIFEDEIRLARERAEERGEEFIDPRNQVPY
jgi:hypothetical protein